MCSPPAPALSAPAAASWHLSSPTQDPESLTLHLLLPAFPSGVHGTTSTSGSRPKVEASSLKENPSPNPPGSVQETRQASEHLSPLPLTGQRHRLLMPLLRQQPQLSYWLPSCCVPPRFLPLTLSSPITARGHFKIQVPPLLGATQNVLCTFARFQALRGPASPACHPACPCSSSCAVCPFRSSLLTVPEPVQSLPAPEHLYSLFPLPRMLFLHLLQVLHLCAASTYVPICLSPLSS